MSFKITKKLSKVGASVGIIVDKPVLEMLDADVGDVVEVVISKHKAADTYYCSACGNIFDLADDFPYCTICGNDEVVKKIYLK